MKSKADYAKNKDGKSMMGLDAPIFPLKSPGIASIPLDSWPRSLAASCSGSAMEELFDEIDVRQNTGIGIAKAAEH